MPNSNRGVRPWQRHDHGDRATGHAVLPPQGQDRVLRHLGHHRPSWPPPWPPADGTPSSPCSPAWPAGTSSALPPGVIVAAWPVIRAIWWWAPETVLRRRPGLRLDRARRPHHPALPARRHRRDRRRPRRHQAGPRPHHTRSAGAWSPGTASGPAFRSSSSPTAPAACR